MNEKKGDSLKGMLLRFYSLKPSQTAQSKYFPTVIEIFPWSIKTKKMETKQSTKENHYGLSKIRHRPHNNQEGVLNE